MIVLGISCYYHDAAAALVRDGTVVAAAAEERFCRRKHTAEFPRLAVGYCLEAAGIGIADVDHIVFYEKPFTKFHRILVNHIVTWPRSWISWTKAIPVWTKEKLRIGRIIQKELGTDEDILFCEHHISHAASAFLPSPYEKAAILTADGVGEWGTTTTGVGDGTQITIDRQISFPHSLGLFYSALTSYLGFRVNDAEWKVMGLAPYGKPRYVESFRRMFDVKEDGSFRLDLRYFSHHFSTRRMYSRRWQALLGHPPRPREAELEQHHSDLAHSGQKVVEEILVALATSLHQRTGLDDLVISGGVGLNSVANWRMLKQSGFRNIFIQPAAGDDGGALGAALFIYHSVLDNPRGWRMSPFLGPGFEQDEIVRALDAEGAVYDVVGDDDTAARTAAEMIADGKVIGWFQGRMEFGPRSLGARSILADPRSPETKERINRKIKYREAFRPFAPSVLAERAHEYFGLEPGQEAPFMLLIPPVLEEMRKVIPAVTHEDGSGRVQTVRREDHPLFYRLIEAFDAATGVPVLVNTSFNVRGEPIVCTPEEAYSCFCRTGLDALVIGRCVVTRKPDRVDHEAGMARSEELERDSVHGT